MILMNADLNSKRTQSDESMAEYSSGFTPRREHGLDDFFMLLLWLCCVASVLCAFALL